MVLLAQEFIEWLGTQCRCGLPVPHIPHEPGLPLQLSLGAAAPPLEANTESFFDNFGEPQCGQRVPFERLERTRISLSRSHFWQ
jgi:hypothetical protein